MSQAEFNNLLDSLAGLSPEQLAQLRDRMESFVSPPLMCAYSEAEQADSALQRRLFEAGVIGEIKPARRVDTGTEAFTPIRIDGEPLSETVIRERR